MVPNGNAPTIECYSFTKMMVNAWSTEQGYGAPRGSAVHHAQAAVLLMYGSLGTGVSLLILEFVLKLRDVCPVTPASSTALRQMLYLM
jgi:hypothetical protein